VGLNLKTKVMRKLVLILGVVLTSLSSKAQGIITVESVKDDVPLEQWYVIRDKAYNNQEFYYAETIAAKAELQRILEMDEQDVDFPKGTDADGDPYWVILKENEHLVYIYFSKDDEDYSLITVLVE
jgi:hypothetical protein